MFENFASELSSLSSFFSTSGPLFIALLFILASFLLARVSKKYCSKFLISLFGEKNQSQIAFWTNIFFWLIFSGSIILLGGFLYDNFFYELTKSTPTQKFGVYFSRFLSALIIFLFGIILAGVLSSFVKSAFTRLDYPHAHRFSKLAGVIIASLFALVAIEQLDIQIELLQYIILLAFGLVGLSFAISLGFGTKMHSAQIISGTYARNIYQPGMTISLEDMKGKIICVTPTLTVIELKNHDRVNIPNDVLMSSLVKIHAQKESEL